MLWAPIALGLLAWSGSAYSLDICGCAGNPNSLGDFDSAVEATWPAGTVRIGQIITIPLPDDGVLIFDSFLVFDVPGSTTNAVINFQHNPANTVVTLLVSGDLTIAAGNRIDLNAVVGSRGSTASNGIGGLGGPGGFRGGDGAYQLVNFKNDGGAGLGPAGGDGATLDPVGASQAGQFVGIPELLPMIGGSGGGGGRSDSVDLGCSGGGGGGGGGGLLVAVNGTASIDGSINSNGASGGLYYFSTCASSGAAGSGGSIRVIAESITGVGTVNALRGSGTAAYGAIRLEAFTNTLPGSNTTPVATRVPAPGPLANPITSSVAITSVAGEVVSQVNGELLSELPQGWMGEVDILLPTPGIVAVDVASSEVPEGTTVDVVVKPSPGGLPFTETAILGNCDGFGGCTAQVSVNLAAGRYVIEAQATFQTP
ncbi:MAG: hypothetical protein OI74_04580 [Gammaproteobacteria bacterium (ex Lamellibrachia satsuma)]|nr:MAG: hypothetical protein OI74_04580 [Gammaproteobacteria bacterium (ex Lamellibrachia satsuma)]RRS35278.1 MAG: hypothetical protein NV67_10990 [Gammaproteobacteria bacterium (ex Lamellibrachia satsuma)]